MTKIANSFQSMTNQVDKRTWGLISFVLMIGLIIYSIVLMQKTVAGTLKISKTITEQENKVIMAKTKLGYLQALDKEVVKQRVSQMEKVFPSERPVMNLLNSLKQATIKHQVSFNGITLNPGVIKSQKSQKPTIIDQDSLSNEPKLDSFNISISLVGKLNDIFAFIDDLKNTAPLISIDTLDISSLDQKEESMINASLGITVYYQSPPTALMAEDAPVNIFTEEDEKLFDLISQYTVYQEIQPRLTSVGRDNFFSQP
jgi:Tfp pilus assembly protein PilO